MKRIVSHLSKLLVLFGALAFFASCESTTTVVDNPIIKKGSLFVLNEGNYSKTDASLDVYSLDSQKLLTDVIPGLGSVGNDIKLINGKLYIVLNASGKIVVIDPTTLAKLKTIQFGGVAPNKITPISATEAIVTELYSHDIAILNTVTDSIASIRAVPGGTVDCAVMNGKAFLSGSDTNLVYPFDLATRQFGDPIIVSPTPQTILVDSANNQLVLLGWGVYQTVGPTIDFINPTTGARTTTNFTVAQWVQSIVMGNGKIYTIMGDRVATIDPKSHAITDLAMKSYYGGFFDQATQDLYVGTGNFSGANAVDVLDGNSGALKQSFAGGIAPAHFALYR